MHKEVLIAIVFGSLLGVVVAFGVWKANTVLKPKSEVETMAVAQEQEEKPEFGLSIASPSDRSISTSSDVLVTGITRPKLLVAMGGEEDFVFVRADEKGEFEEEIELVGGVNEIWVNSFDENSVVSESILVVYSTQFEKNEEEGENGEATDEVEVKVEKKLREAASEAMALLGTVTDITEASLQARSLEGEIKQISIDDETSYSNIVKAAKEVEFSDLAIGDFIVALGFPVNGNGVFEARRILVSTPLEPLGKKALVGTVKEIGGGEIVLTASDEEIAAEYTTSTAVSTETKDGEIIKWSLSKIEEGDRLALVGLEDEGELEVEAIFVYPTEN